MQVVLRKLFERLGATYIKVSQMLQLLVRGIQALQSAACLVQMLILTLPTCLAACLMLRW